MRELTKTYLQKHSFALLQLTGLEVCARQVKQKLSVVFLLELANAIFILKSKRNLERQEPQTVENPGKLLPFGWQQ